MRREVARVRTQLGPTFHRVRRGLLWATPGQLDAGFASLATFVAGVYAVRELSTVSLAGYALLFSAFHVINQVSAEIVFSPSQIIAVDLPGRQRLGMLAHSMPRGSLVAFFSSFAVPLGVLTIASQIPVSDLIPLLISALLLAFASPVQDHLRAMLHMAEASWIAAVMSAVHLATTLSALLAFSSLSPPWAPFGALFAGNCLSLAVGGVWVGRQQVPASPRPTFRELRWLGGWLLASGIGKTALRYAITAFLNLVAGVAALGYVEGARVVSQPINVLAQGLMAQVGPRLTAAAAQKDRSTANRWARRFTLLLCGAAVPYAVLTAWPWSLNPLATIAPRAYVVPGLTAATSLGVLVASLMRAQRIQLLGARLQKTVARVTIATGLLELALIGTGVIVGAYASPLAAGIVAVLGVIWFSRRMRRVYVELPEDSPAMTSG